MCRQSNQRQCKSRWRICLALESGDVGKFVTSIEIVGECLVGDFCVDQYLWALYQRTPKEDTIKEVERRKIAVKRKGRW